MEEKRKKRPNDIFLGRRKGTDTLVQTSVKGGKDMWNTAGAEVENQAEVHDRALRLENCWFLKPAPVLGPVCIFEESTHFSGLRRLTPVWSFIKPILYLKNKTKQKNTNFGS